MFNHLLLYLRPRSNLLLKPVYAGLIATWIIAFGIAFVPLIPNLEDYFVDTTWLEKVLRNLCFIFHIDIKHFPGVEGARSSLR